MRRSKLLLKLAAQCRSRFPVLAGRLPPPRGLGFIELQPPAPLRDLAVPRILLSPKPIGVLPGCLGETARMLLLGDRELSLL